MNKAALSSLLDQWRQNPRLRVGGWLVIVILLVYALFLLSDVQRSFQDDYDVLAARLQKLENLSQEDEWSERETAAKALRVQMEGRLWRAESRGLAKANLQTWMDNMVRKFKIDDYRIQVEDSRDVEDIEGVWQVAVRTEASFDPQKFIQLLRALETNPQLITVHQIDIRQARRPVFRLTFRAYFLAPV